MQTPIRATQRRIYSHSLLENCSFLVVLTLRVFLARGCGARISG